jgi:aminomethyltransferase
MYPFADQGPGDSLWELGLDFTVSPGKTGFRGAEEHIRLQGKERFKIFGLLIDADRQADAGDEVWADGRKVGVITCPSYSTLTRKSMAIARLDVDKAVHGARLEVRGKSLEAAASAHTLPFDDPDKKKRTVVG